MEIDNDLKVGRNFYSELSEFVRWFRNDCNIYSTLISVGPPQLVPCPLILDSNIRSVGPPTPTAMV